MSKLKQTEGRELILARYESGPARLREAVAGLSKTSLDVALDAETWTIRQIVHHVVDGDDIWKTCIKMALGNGKATFDLQWYWTIPQTVWAERWAYADRAIEPSLTLFEANRRHVAQLMREIPTAWDRSLAIQWPHRDEPELVAVGWVIEMQSRHVTGHIEDILKIRETHQP